MVAVYGEVKSMRRIDLTDGAFCLVARFSTISRLENAVAVCEFLTENFHKLKPSYYGSGNHGKQVEIRI